MRARAFALLGAAVLLALLGAAVLPRETVLEERDHWTVSAVRQGLSAPLYDCAVLDSGGRCLLEERMTAKPRLSMVSGQVVRLFREDGGIRQVRYVQLKTGEVSPWVSHPAADSENYTAFLCETEHGPQLRIQSLFGGGYQVSLALPFSQTAAPGELVRDGRLEGLTFSCTYLNRKEEAVPYSYGLMDWERNPIDRFYERYDIYDGSTYAVQAAEWVRASAWEAEVRHAYDLLAEASPRPEARALAEQARQDFLASAESEAELECAYGWSNTFDGAGAETEGIFGTGAKAGYFTALSRLYRERALALYRMVERTGVDGAFVFDGAAHLRELREGMALPVTEKEP